MDHHDGEWAPPALEIEKTSYTVREFLEWEDARRLTLSPEFQRGEVWKTPAKAFLIDTILRGFPIPPLHIRLVSREANLMREVIDGQQRINSVLGFARGAFRLARPRVALEPPPPWAGLKFERLPQDLQDRFLNYSFRCEVYKGNIDDGLIYEIFSRINIYSIPLSDQELRNGRFFGDFKQAVYHLRNEQAPFWKESGLFSKQAMARMLDAEFVSEALAIHIEGMLDKKKHLDTLYMKFDTDWADRTEHEHRFRMTIDGIRGAIGDLLPATKFSRIALFYTLYAVMYHRLFGIANQKIPDVGYALPASPVHPLTADSAERLRYAVQVLSEALDDPKSDYPEHIADFILASSRQTDNLRPRLARFRTLWDLAVLSET